MRFADPYVLFLLPLIFALLWDNQRRGRQRQAAVGYSDLRLVRWSAAARPRWEEHIPLAVNSLAIVLLVLALARPQAGLANHQVSASGVNIMLCLDTSGSMAAQDLKPDRVSAARDVSKAFVQGREGDRIGLVVFSAVALTECPLTMDHGALQTLLDAVKDGITKTDGTAIGNALATCCNRLKDVSGKSKIIVLLTDGRNNMGEIDPLTAAKLAAKVGIRIYTIGIGTRGPAPFPVSDPVFGTRLIMIHEDLDEVVLTNIADLTGGKYFRATDTPTLTQIYQEIDHMEKAPLPKSELYDYRELYPWFLLPALLLLLMNGLLERTLLQEVP